MIIYYALEDYAAGDYWVARQSGFRQFLVAAQNRRFSVPAR